VLDTCLLARIQRVYVLDDHTKQFQKIGLQFHGLPFSAKCVTWYIPNIGPGSRPNWTAVMWKCHVKSISRVHNTLCKHTLHSQISCQVAVLQDHVFELHPSFTFVFENRSTAAWLLSKVMPVPELYDGNRWLEHRNEYEHALLSTFCIQGAYWRHARHSMVIAILLSENSVLAAYSSRHFVGQNSMSGL
jgi:hypothetical protein